MNKKEEIFTIGDKTNNGTISKFEIGRYGIKVFFEEKPKNYHVSLNSISHVKKPLFKTSDGVDIFKGDEFYCAIFPIGFGISKQVGGNNLLVDIESVRQRTFSTKEKAEKYINDNVNFKLEDIRKAFKAGSAYASESHKYFKQTHPDENEFIKSLILEKYNKSDE